MIRYALNPKPEKSVKVYNRGARVSRKNSVTVCRAISGLQLEKGRRMLTGLLNHRESLGGRYYTNVAKELSEMLRSAENNAEFKGLDPGKLVIRASAHKGFGFFRPRRFKFRRSRRKVCNLQMVLVQR